MELYAYGDHALMITFNQPPNKGLTHRLLQLQADAFNIPGVINALVGYTSVLVEWDPVSADPELIMQELQNWRSEGRGGSPSRHWQIPVFYGGADGPDLCDVANYHHITPEEVIALHSHRPYPIYCLGFSLGFAYLGGLPEALHTPRRASPRIRVPKGSVAIGGHQTGVYPSDSPGGWQIIGRTPMVLANPTEDPPVSYAPGDTIEFVPIQRPQDGIS